MTCSRLLEFFVAGLPIRLGSLTLSSLSGLCREGGLLGRVSPMKPLGRVRQGLHYFHLLPPTATPVQPIQDMPNWLMPSGFLVRNQDSQEWFLVMLLICCVLVVKSLNLSMHRFLNLQIYPPPYCLSPHMRTPGISCVLKKVV